MAEAKPAKKRLNKEISHMIISGMNNFESNKQKIISLKELSEENIFINLHKIQFENQKYCVPLNHMDMSSISIRY